MLVAGHDSGQEKICISEKDGWTLDILGDILKDCQDCARYVSFFGVKKLKKFIHDILNILILVENIRIELSNSNEPIQRIQDNNLSSWVKKLEDRLECIIDQLIYIIFMAIFTEGGKQDCCGLLVA